MTTIVNRSDDALQLTVRLKDGTSYGTTVPPGGAWGIPADVIAVEVDAD